MSMNVNNCTFVGRLVQDPSLTSHKKKNGEGNTDRTFMRLAVTRLGDLRLPQKERRTNYIPITVWGPQAGHCAQYLEKGTEVTAIGEYIVESKPIMKDNVHLEIDGVKQYREFHGLLASTIQFGQRSRKNQPASGDVGGVLADLQSQINKLSGNSSSTPATTSNSTLSVSEGTMGVVGDAKDPFFFGEEGEAVTESMSAVA